MVLRGTGRKTIIHDAAAKKNGTADYADYTDFFVFSSFPFVSVRETDELFDTLIPGRRRLLFFNSTLIFGIRRHLFFNSALVFGIR